jgi:molecular chaperone GrpE
MHRPYVAALREAGVEPFDSVGRPFDPAIHEAVATAPATGTAVGVVVREERRGSLLEEELLRPTRVVVAAASTA